MTINFYLDSKANKHGMKSVYCYIRGIGKKNTLYVNTGIKIHPKDWNHDKQQFRKTYPKHSDSNTFLDHFRMRVQNIYRQIISSGDDFDKSVFKLKINEMLNGTEKKQLTFSQFFDKFIEARESSITLGTKKHYLSFRNHLSRFEKEVKYKLSFESIDYTFFDKFIAYLQKDVGLTNNTIHKQICWLKAFMNWATDREYNKNLDYRKFKTKEEETDIVYLTEDELMKLKSIQIKNNRLANLRDVFCFACFTGQRFSDVSEIKPEDVKNGFWHLRVQKTKSILKIPLSKPASEILRKYFDNGIPLPVISNQKSNEYLKELCKFAEIDDPIKTIRYKGSEKIETTHPKYELITTHTARRTFVTLSLEKGLRAETVMKITGHKDYKTMKRYLKITENVVKTEMERVWG
jgi:integrase